MTWFGTSNVYILLIKSNVYFPTGWCFVDRRSFFLLSYSGLTAGGAMATHEKTDFDNHRHLSEPDQSVNDGRGGSQAS